MIVLRLVGFVFLLSLGGLFLLFLTTRNRRYLTFAYALIKFGVALVAAFAAFYVVERLILAV